MAHIFGSIWDRFNRNALNDLSKNVETQGKSIQNLVAEGQLTPRQYAELVSIVNGNIKSGEVAIYDLEDSLRTEVDKINGKINKGEVTNQDIDRNNFKIDQTMISDSLRQMIAGDAPINAVPADGSITREKLAPNAVGEHQTNFITANNLWDGINHRYFHLQGSADAVRHVDVLGTSHYSAIIKVSPGETYTILKKEGGDRFNIAVLEKIPELNDDENALFVYRGSNSGNPQSRTITIPAGGRFLIVHTNTYIELLPDIVVSQGETAVEDEKLKFNKEIEGYPKLIKSEKNLFVGDYSDFGLIYVPTQQRAFVVDNKYDGTKRKSAVIEVLPNKKYSITIPNKDHKWFRVVGFSSHPVSNSTADEIYNINEGGVKNPDDNILTITTGENIRYIVIYTSSDSTQPHEPALQVEVGEPTKYEPYEHIPEKYIQQIPKVKEELSIVAEKDARFNFYQDLTKLYTSEPLTDYFESPNGLSAEQFNQLYKDLAATYSEKIELEVVGNDEWGNELLKVETKVVNYNEVHTGSGNDGTTGDSINQPKLVITTGMHGHEKSAMYATYYFLKELLESESDLMNFILDNIKLVIMPLCNPSGFNNTQRHNDNNVDINRNFWSTSNVQAETEIIKQVLNAHSDMDFYIDYHTLIPRSSIIGYTFTNNQALAYTANNMYRNVGRHWQKTNSRMPQGRDVVFSFTTPALDGMAVEYVESSMEIDSVLLELTNGYSYLASGNYTEPVVRMGVEFLTNMITGALRLRQ